MRSAYAMLLTVVVIGLFGIPSVCSAQEFRVETDVFIDQEKQPVVETLTIFSHGVVYDFLLTDVEEITFFDRDRNRLVLMDTRRQVKTELTMDSILSFVAQMKVHLSDSEADFLLAKEIDVNTKDGWLELSNDRVTYRARGVQPEEVVAAKQFQQFADWYARLNAMRQGNLPPFTRIRLNSELAAKGLIPKTIERTVVRKRGLKEQKQTLRSQHSALWRLSVTDRKRIDRAATNLATFRTISFRDYIELPAVASK